MEKAKGSRGIFMKGFPSNEILLQTTWGLKSWYHLRYAE
jgi:hypothetical protein